MARHAIGFYPRIIYMTTQPPYFTMLVVDAAHAGIAPQADPGLEMATDDWPFPYLHQRGIPAIYRNAMFAVAGLIAVIAVFLYRSSPRDEEGRQSGLFLRLAFIFMGVAFLLLETKSVIQFSLLFGTTWINNSLVFLSVL